METILVNDCEHEEHQVSWSQNISHQTLLNNLMYLMTIFKDTYHEHCVLEYVNGQAVTGDKEDEIRPGVHSLSFYFDCHVHDHDHEH